MGKALHERLATRRFEGPHHEALLNLILAHNHVRGQLDEIFAGEGLTQGQYNVLRILNGAHPQGYARGEIARRVLDRAPDLTRMIDRLERQGLVKRGRGEDGRESIARITAKGRRLVAAIHPHVHALNRVLAGSMSERDARTLSRLCERVYAEAK